MGSINLNGVWGDVQSVLVQSVKELFALYPELNNIGVFTTVPRGAVVPYIKITGAKSQGQQLFDDNSFAGEFQLTAFGFGRNGWQLTALNCVCHQLPSHMLNKPLACGLSIVNVVPGDVSVEEDLEVNAWRGMLNLRVVAGI